MRRRADADSGPGRFQTRRHWLAGALSVSAHLFRGSQAAEPAAAGDADETEEVDEVTVQAARGGLKGFETLRSRNYLAIGNAPLVFMRLTLQDCERVAIDFFDHYLAKGFELTRPEQRLTLVVLADRKAFSAYLRKSVDTSTGGVYEKKTNRLVVYDYRAAGPQTPLRAGHASLMSLAHEAIHQLCFNTGLLDPQSDVPTSIVEGLAMYGEIRKTNARTEPGQINSIRLDDLARLQRRGLAWIPVAELFETDNIVRGVSGNDRRLLAYAESWLLVHFLMNDPARLSGFRAYLKTIKSRRTADRRLDDARTHLGDLDQLNKDLRAASIRTLRGR